MGSGASSAILQGPLDGSDLTDLNQAQAEVGKLRTVIHQYANQDWHEVANKASAEKKGWGIWNGKVLLAGASKQYDQPVTLEMGDCIPFNETSDWFKEGSADHWFNIPLNTPEIKKDTGMFIPGKLFTTRMPRGIDLEKNEEWPTETIDKVKNQGRTMRQYFEEKVKDEHITHAFVLVEIFEMEKVCSKSLLTYYESLGITVHHTPIVDFTAPALEIEAKNIEDLNLALVKGENCIVHCMGGTGRTGTVIVGAIQNLGFDHAIKHIRKYGKSTYLEIKEQEELIEAQSKVLTAKMMKQCPGFTYKIVLDHLEELCSEMKDGKFSVVDAADPIGAGEEGVLLKVFNLIDLQGSDGICSLADFGKFLTKMIKNSGLALEAYKNLNDQSLLQKMFAAIDPSVALKRHDEDAITWSVFKHVMNLKPAFGDGVSVATTAAAHGH